MWENLSAPCPTFCGQGVSSTSPRLLLNPLDGTQITSSLSAGLPMSGGLGPVRTPRNISASEKLG